MPTRSRSFRLRRPVELTDLALAIGERALIPASVTLVAPLEIAGSGALTFAAKLPDYDLSQGSVVIAGEATRGVAIAADNPRLTFIHALDWLNREVGFGTEPGPPEIHPTSEVGSGAYVARGVTIGPHCRIGENAIIARDVCIGAYCVIKPGAVIGEQGFGFDRRPHGPPVRFPHLGTVVIGDRVEIGARCTIARGTLGDTVIADHVKIDDSAHVAHNCFIGQRSLIHAGVVLCGGVEIGQDAWVGPNASVIQHVRIGAGAMVGIGANVIRPVPDNAVVGGNPARLLRLSERD